MEALLEAGASPRLAGLLTPRATVAERFRHAYYNFTDGTVASLRLLLDRGAPIVCPDGDVSLLDNALDLASDAWLADRTVQPLVALMDLGFNE